MPKPMAMKRDAAGAWFEAHAKLARKQRAKRSAADLIRERVQHLYILRLDGYTYREIATRANQTHSAVLYAIRRISDPVKLSTEGRVLGTA
jgi:hypothetical protein